MKIYLCAPIIANRDLQKARLIAKTMWSLGCEIISDWVIEEDPGYSLPPREVFERDVEGIKKCDLLVAEVTTPSHGVGMEIMLAHTLGKPVVCLFRKGVKISHMILGLTEATLIEYYSEREMGEKLRRFIQNFDC
jgi:nucleoside 2-deoxyribosyltransferase